jgi:hypothetical protein
MIPIFYLALVVLALFTIFKSGWVVGLSLFFACFLSLVAGVRIHSLLRQESWTKGEHRKLAIIGLVVSLAIVGLVQWLLADKFSVRYIGDFTISGAACSWIFFLIGCIFSNGEILRGVGIRRGASQDGEERLVPKTLNQRLDEMGQHYRPIVGMLSEVLAIIDAASLETPPRMTEAQFQCCAKDLAESMAHLLDAAKEAGQKIRNVRNRD